VVVVLVVLVLVLLVVVLVVVVVLVLVLMLCHTDSAFFSLTVMAAGLSTASVSCLEKQTRFETSSWILYPILWR
jgi:type IV secretory pathway VirB3-like protein